MNKNSFIKPILKWVGGKRQLLSEIVPLIPKNINTYVEPFVGGGAVLFDIQPNKAIINDSNSELINVYKTIMNNPDELIEELKIHKLNNSSDYFYEIRAIDREKNYKNYTTVNKASRIIYLNKTCYNGLYRVNQSGFFNTPYGRYKNPDIVNEITIKALSKYFNDNHIEIYNEDYSNVISNLDKNDFVYFDPPYVPISTSSSFTGYTEGGFTLENQKELKNYCDKLTEKGVRFLLSNSDSEFIHDLYSDYNIKTVKAKRFINSKAKNRGEINEVLVSNYEI
ncbi:modification methylase [Staphylococcus sp. HMSC063F03]|nr:MULTISPECIES: DNA adenine methylase [Staphylococcus]MBE7318586.1 DNA adenine methylase [Staphylococcus epidermidis]MBU5606129.1 DNA adenine methylase [Staphylococcus hominis]MCG2133440.1 DNA adenine methylase [Staphylococcus epidermidis]MCG2282313.1 DNA adenine methylase [Staphylococcus epidermidis]MDK7201192.1 DNA adenine methylase [Staphylococcus hominis]